VILGLVLAGSAWVRFRPSRSSGTAAGLAPAAQGESIPDVTARDASVVSGGLRVVLSVSPRPPVAFSDMQVRVRAEAAGPASALPARAITLDDATVTFEMSMPMGDHRYTLVRGKDGWLEATVVLPLCGSGDPHWFATVEGTVAGRRRAARFRLDLRPQP
jgi:hypothetical protein